MPSWNLTIKLPSDRPNYQGVLITSFDKILITVSILTKENGRVIRPLQDLTNAMITYA